MNIKNHIRSIPDFPSPASCSTTFPPCSPMPKPGKKRSDNWPTRSGRISRTCWSGSSRADFWWRPPLALTLGLGFVMIRKRGKLPGDIITHNYDLEYGTDTIEIQADAIKPGARVVVCDDLLATGARWWRRSTCCVRSAPKWLGRSS